jgi:hypothetical protein
MLVLCLKLFCVDMIVYCELIVCRIWIKYNSCIAPSFPVRTFILKSMVALLILLNIYGMAQA